MYAVISLHHNIAIENAVRHYFDLEFPHIKVLNVDQCQSLVSDNMLQEICAACRVLIYDQEFATDYYEMKQEIRSQCLVKPTEIVLGHDPQNETIVTELVRPLRMGEVLDRIDAALATTFENIHVDQIDCCPFGVVNITAKRWEPASDTVADFVPLTDKELMLLYTLSKTQSGPLGRKILYESVWGFSSELETHTLETHIYRLRQKIELDPSKPQIIKTYDDRYALVNFEE